MPLHANKAGIWKTVWGLLTDGNSQPNTNPDISDDIQQTMDRNFGLDAVKDMWRELSVDPTGRLRTTRASYVQNFISPVLWSLNSGTDQMVLDVNLNRNYAYILNTGNGSISLALRAGDNTFQRGLNVPQGAGFQIDGWLGQIFLYPGSGGINGNATVLEI